MTNSVISPVTVIRPMYRSRNPHTCWFVAKSPHGGNITSAEKYYRRVIEIAQELRMPLLEATARESLPQWNGDICEPVHAHVTRL